MDIRSEEVLGWRMVELDIPESFASLNDVKVWLEDRLMSGGPGAIFTPLREMLSDDSPAKEELGKLQYDWEQRRSEEARRSFYESEESPMRNFVRAIAEEDLVEGLIAPQGATSWFLGIGISKHLQLPDIRNAVNDVLEMQRTLEEKYELDESTLLFDAEATTENILKNFDELLDRVKPADRVLIYYCGHTEMDPKLDRGYWLPFDAEANRRSSYLDNNTIIDYIRNISCKDLLLIVDGVFSGALFESGRGSTAQSYTEPSAGVSRWGFVSGQDKGIVGDGPPARFSPFADSILEVLKRNTEPQLGIEEIAEQVTKSMMSRVSARQTPAFGPLWGAGHGEGEYVFRLKESAAGEGQVTEEAAAAEEQRILTLEGHEAGVNCVAFSPDGNLIASGSDDQTVRVWEAGTGKEMMTLERHKSSVSSLAFSSDGQKIISGSEDGTIVIWEFLIGDITQIAGEESRVNCIRVLPEGNAFISGSEDGMIRIWDISGNLLTTLSEHKGSVNSIALNLAEQQFLSGSTDRTFKIWDLRKGALIRTFEGHGEEVHGVLFTPDGQSIISYTWGGPIKVWDAQTGNLRFVMDEHPPEVRKMVALSIGSDIATASADGLVRIWNLENRELLQSFSGHNGIITDLAYNQDDLLLASSSLDGTVKVWQIATQTQEETINQPDPVIKKLQADMVPVAGGTFTMGWLNKERDGEGYDREKPAHEVTLDDFYIGRYPVTQAQWRAVMGNNPSSNKPCDDCPVENVSWNDVQDFLKKLNELTDQNYRLPTEAEWEFAARGGNQSQGYLYSGSNDLDEVGWYEGNSNSKTHPVGQKKANELGLFDMSGNVWEWCQDWYGDYPSAPQKNPKGRESGSFRVYRGGSWYSYPRGCSAAYRDFAGPSVRDPGIGFLLARSSR
jgi:WD40 repeat protein